MNAIAPWRLLLPNDTKVSPGDRRRADVTSLGDAGYASARPETGTGRLAGYASARPETGAGRLAGYAS
ncbi:MAG: hypothetical protein LW768_10190, partial [Rubrivivax sp.]|nr:hypothetical protein [Rubrivivax sp.]